MKNKKINTKVISLGIYGLCFIVSTWSLMSNSSGVPQGVTGSPAEASHNSCGTCHDSPSNYVPSVSLQILNQNQNVVTTYKPGESYTLRVQVSATNNPKSFGFQLSTLDLATNTDQGAWSQFGDRVKQLNLTIQQKERKYIVQSSPKENGLFTATWKAPASDKGAISFYYAGLAVNLNGSNSGDTHVTGQLTLQSQSTSSSDDLDSNNKICIFPNPTRDVINLNSEDILSVKILDIIGRNVSINMVENGKIDISHLNPGMYYLTIKDNIGFLKGKHTIIKL